MLDPTEANVTLDANADAYLALTHKWAAARAEWGRTYYDLTAENEQLREALHEATDWLMHASSMPEAEALGERLSRHACKEIQRTTRL